MQNLPARVLEAHNLRKKLLNPKNAVQDHGIDLRRGRPGGAKGGIQPGKPATIRVMMTTVRPPVSRPAMNLTTGANISTTICRLTGDYVEVLSKGKFKHNEIRAKYRGGFHVLARQISMFLIHKRTNRSFPQIAHYFDMDHTTVMHAVHKVRDLIARGHKIREHVEAVEAIYDRHLLQHPLPTKPQPELAVDVPRSARISQQAIQAVAYGRPQDVADAAATGLPEDQIPLLHTHHAMEAG